MILRMPRNLSTSARFETGPSALEAEIAQERALALGRAGREVETALGRLKDIDPNAPERARFVAAAADAAWSFFVQREACGLFDHAQAIADWYDLGLEALQTLANAHRDESPSEPTLWPEHFDLALSVSDVNYGASPGDEHITEPYLYVGPHDGPPTGDPAFWNAPFGAARTFRQIGTVAEAAAFFRDGRACAQAATLTETRRTP